MNGFDKKGGWEYTSHDVYEVSCIPTTERSTNSTKGKWEGVVVRSGNEKRQVLGVSV
jgi:hypothetical protein